MAVTAVYSARELFELFVVTSTCCHSIYHSYQSWLLELCVWYLVSSNRMFDSILKYYVWLSSGNVLPCTNERPQYFCQVGELSPFLTVWCMYFILSVIFLHVIRNRA